MSDYLIRDLEILSNTNIYFGHQSVGYDIMDGLKKILKATNAEIKLNIVELDSIRSLPENYFAHSRVGENTIPLSKCNDFRKILDTNILKEVNLAMFKFCYVDISKDTDVLSLFDMYKMTIDSVRSKYPDIKIIHITIPLKANIFNWKTPIKMILGRETDVKPENIKRNEFNEILIEYYKNEPIFDLAKIESTRPDGTREKFMVNDKIYYSLVPTYTYDGGHLNTIGSTIVAKELIKVISDVIKCKN